MLKVSKGDEPEFFKEFKRKNQLHNWKEYAQYPEIKQQLKEHMLLEEQETYCPYCEALIEEIDKDTCEVEHIKPKDIYPGLFQEYSNLLAGCRGINICGNAKGNEWGSLFIDPTLEDPEEYFDYDIKSGEIVPKEKTGEAYEKAQYTIKILNLNEKSLKEYRKTYILQMINMKDYLDCLHEMPSLVRYFKKNFL